MTGAAAGPWHGRRRGSQRRRGQQHPCLGSPPWWGPADATDGAPGGKAEKKGIAFTKLGHPVKDMIKSLEGIYLFSLPTKECESLTFSWGPPSETRF